MVSISVVYNSLTLAESFFMQVQTHQYSSFAVTYEGISMNTGETVEQQVTVWPDFGGSLNSVTLLPDKYHGQGSICWSINALPGSGQQPYCLCCDLVRALGLAKLILVRLRVFAEMLWQLMTQ